MRRKVLLKDRKICIDCKEFLFNMQPHAVRCRGCNKVHRSKYLKFRYDILYGGEIMTEKVAKVGITKEKGYLYFVDKDGDIGRAKMARAGKSRA